MIITDFKYLVFLFLSFLLSSIAYANERNTDVFEREELEFYVLESELIDGKYITGDKDKLGFVKYNKQEIPHERTAGNRMITLRADLLIANTRVEI